MVLAGLLAALCASPGSTEEVRIDTPDGARRAVVVAAPRAPAPTVMVLHGAGGSSERTLLRSGFAEAAARHGFAAVFPQALRWQWNDGRVFRPSGADDVGFLRRLARELVRRGIADPDRLYIAGISNGGMMTFRMLCEASDLFAGAGTVIANMPARVGRNCLLEQPVTVVMFNGTADPLVPYDGGGVGFIGRRGDVWAAEHTAAFLARDYGCAEFSELVLGSGARADLTRVTRLGWSRCAIGRSVILYRIEGGGHQIFGHRNALSFVFGRGTSQISAPETIMAAFAGQQEVVADGRYASGSPAWRRPSR